MKFLFYSDLHIRPERLADCEKVLTQVGKLAKEHGAVIVNGGDTHNTRGIIRTQCFDRLYSHYRGWADAGLKQVILVGNHDQEDRAGEIHPMRAFQSFKGWSVIDRPTMVKGIAQTIFFPYMKMDAIEKELAELKPTIGRGQMDAVVHWGIRGAKRNDFNTDTDGVPAEWLANFRRVFSGHYHYRNTFKNIQYIGSPFQQNHGERGQEKGVLLYDNEKNESEFIEIKGTPKHHEIEIDLDGKDPKIDITGVRQGDYVLCRVFGDAEKCASVTQESLKERVHCAELKIERKVREKSHSRLKIETSEIFSPSALAQKYVDFVDSDLDRTKLMRLGRMIFGEAHA